MVTTSAANRLSHASPHFRVSQPTPPPRVRPASPVVEPESLAAACGISELGPGEYAFRNGDRASELFVVESGQLKETMSTPDGAQLVVEVFTPGAAFGEPALFVPERTRMADISAMEPARVLTIERDLLVAFLFRHPQSMLRMLEGLAAGFRSQAEAAIQMAFQEIRQRLISKLLELADTHGQPVAGGIRIELDLSQATLAGLIGATRENVNRALAPLITAGTVRPQGKRYVLDAEALRLGLATGEPWLHRRDRAELAWKARI